MKFTLTHFLFGRHAATLDTMVETDIDPAGERPNVVNLQLGQFTLSLDCESADLLADMLQQACNELLHAREVSVMEGARH